MSITLKVGQKLRHAVTDNPFEIVYVDRSKINIVVRDKSGSLWVVRESAYNNYVNEWGFFKVGSTYKFNNIYSKDLYKIIELHQVDDAIDEGNETVALATCTTPEGKNMLALLTGNDFPHMVKV